MSNDRDDDASALMAQIAVALASAKAAAPPGASVLDVISLFAKALLVTDWVSSAAARIERTWSAWLTRPYHCARIRWLATQHGAMHAAPDEAQRLRDRLVRTLSSVRFGMPLCESWYLKLFSLIDSGQITDRRLRQLLRCTTWTWDRDGCLVRVPHTGIVGAFIALASLLCTTVAALSISLAVAVAYAQGPTVTAAVSVLSYGAVAVFAGYWIWWCGPRSRSAAAELTGLLDRLGQQGPLIRTPSANS